VGHRFDVAVPLCADRLFSDDGQGRIPGRASWWLSIMGRLKPGWTAARANAYMRTLSAAIMRGSLPATYRPEMAKKFLANRLEATEGATGVSELRRQFQTPLYILLGATGLVLLIACANLANLLLARASVRQREIAVRQAIGAGRGRLVGQLLAESALLAITGTVVGMALAQALSRGLIAFLSTADNPLFVGVGIDIRVMAFTTAVAICACLLFGLVPALRATRLAPASVMRSGGRGTSAGRERFTLRRALVVTQVALSLVLLIGALLFVRSLRNLLTTDAGFRPEGIVTVDLDLRPAHFGKERLRAAYRQLLDRLASRPGVTAAQVNITPMSGNGWNNFVYAEGSSAAVQVSYFNRVTPGYFRTMKTPLLAGRDFDNRDTVASPKVAIVNEVFARKFFGGANPIGRVFRIQGNAGKTDESYQVIGLAANSKYYELREDYLAIAYLPMEQTEDLGAYASYVLRVNGPLADVFSGVTSAVAETHPNIGVEFHVLTAMIQNSLLRDRLMATLSGAFGFLAALLATLGLYGVIAYMVAQRRNEIGVRMALGADRGRVVRLVLAEAAALVGAGVIVGAAAAWWAGQTASALLYGLKAHDPATMGAGIALLAAVALIASYGPARRASRVDPMAALREE
jgi:predicted permease